MVAKKTIEEVREIYKNNGLEFLETEYVNNRYSNKTKCLKCECIWSISISNVVHGYNCPECANKEKRNSIEEINSICKSVGLIFLDQEYKNSK